MTVPAAATTYRYQGNDVTTIFAYSNRLLTEDDVKVQILTRATDAVVETLTKTTDYTVTIVSNSLANITITNATKIPSVTQDILLALNLAISQTRSYPRADSLPAADIERGLDKLTLIAQKLDDGQTLTLRFPESDTTSDGELPSAANRANKYLAFDASGEPVVSEGTDTITSAYGLTLVQADDAAEALSILGAMGKSTYDPANISEQLVGVNAVQSLTRKSFRDFTDPTKGLGFDFSGSSTALVSTIVAWFTSARFFRLPDKSGTLAMADDIFTAQGRLTLTTGVPVTTADVTGATNIYYTPYIGNKIALYTGTEWVSYQFSEMTLALGTITAARPYDVFLDYNSGTPQLVLLAWTNDTTRATALTTQNGVYVKTGDTEQRYLGTFYTTSTTTTEDSKAKRFLWNMYNRRKRRMTVVEATNSWTYSTAAFRQANGSTANQLDFVLGIAEDSVSATAVAGLTSSAAVTVTTSIGLDSTTAKTAEALNSFIRPLATGDPETGFTTYEGLPSAGRHFLAWLEFGGGAGTQTWYGDNGGTAIQTGITGSVFA